MNSGVLDRPILSCLSVDCAAKLQREGEGVKTRAEIGAARGS
jgi:hypothetical protein